MVEAHGTFQTSHCIECDAEYELPWMKEQIFNDKIPRCQDEECKGVVKPGIQYNTSTVLYYCIYRLPGEEKIKT